MDKFCRIITELRTFIYVKNCVLLNITLINVYVALPVFTPVAGSSYVHFIEENGGAQYLNSEFGRYFHFCWR